LIYTAEGDSTWPKEVCTVFGAGLVLKVVNFQELEIRRGRKAVQKKFQGKGHAEQMEAWAKYLRAEAPHPLPYTVSRQSMLLTFATLEALRAGTTVAAG
jgi:hypothetical protein